MLQLLMLERVDPALNMHRYYVLSVEPTLFGDVALRREWGRIGAPRGRARLDFYDGHREAGEALQAWLRRKAARGYDTRPTGRGDVVSGARCMSD